MVAVPAPTSAHCRCRAVGQRAVFRAERDVVGRFRPSPRACRRSDRAPRRSRSCADAEGEEAVEVAQRAFQRLAETRAMARSRGEIGRRHLGVVLGSKRHALADQLARARCCGWTASRYGRGTGRRRSRTGARRSSSPPISVAMRVWPMPCVPAHAAQAEAVDDIARQSDLLVDLDTLPAPMTRTVGRSVWIASAIDPVASP